MGQNRSLESPAAVSILRSIEPWVCPEDIPHFAYGLAVSEKNGDTESDTLSRLLIAMFGNRPMETVLLSFPTASIYELQRQKPPRMSLEQIFSGLLVCSVIAEGAMATKFGSGLRMIKEYGVEEVRQWQRGFKSHPAQLFNDKYRIVLAPGEIKEAVDYLYTIPGWLGLNADMAQMRYARQSKESGKRPFLTSRT